MLAAACQDMPLPLVPLERAGEMEQPKLAGVEYSLGITRAPCSGTTPQPSNRTLSGTIGFPTFPVATAVAGYGQAQQILCN